MLILLANDRNGLRLAQDAPTANPAARRDHQGAERRARPAVDGEHPEEEALARAA